MLSRTAEYALRATLALARRHGEGPLPAATIARSLGAPTNYFSKTLHTLTRHGIIASTRGRQGGFTLAVAPERLTLARVIDAIDAPAQNTVCLLGDAPCDRANPCRAHGRWSAITDAARAPLTTTTIADLLGGRGDHLFLNRS